MSQSQREVPTLSAGAGYRADGVFDRYKYVVDKMLRMTADSPCSSHAQMAHMLMSEADRIISCQDRIDPSFP
jgi:hypothetical protein